MWKVLLLTLVFASSASAEEFRIVYSPGGGVADFLDRARDLRKTKTPIIVDGPCVSACTILVDADASQVCVTRNARLGFHQGTQDGWLGAGRRIQIHYWTPGLGAWIAARGGLPTEGLLWMNYVEAKAFFRPCPELTYSF